MKVTTLQKVSLVQKLGGFFKDTEMGLHQDDGTNLGALNRFEIDQDAADAAFDRANEKAQEWLENLDIDEIQDEVIDSPKVYQLLEAILHGDQYIVTKAAWQLKAELKECAERVKDRMIERGDFDE